MDEAMGGMIAAVLIFAFGLVITVTAIYLIQNSQRKKLQPLADTLGGELTMSYFSGPKLKLPARERDVFVKLMPGGKNQPPFLVLEIATTIPFNLFISRENFATRALNKWGLLKEVTLGDPIMDGKYFIRSNDSMQASYYLLESERIHVIDRFYSEGFGQFRAMKGTITLMKGNYSDSDLAPERILALADEIEKLA